MRSEDKEAQAVISLRAEIDEVDSAILQLLSKRAHFALRIGKAKEGSSRYRPEREAQILARLTAENNGPLPNSALTAIFREVMSSCRALEQVLVIAHLGPAGTFSESAARAHFGSAPQLLACTYIDDVFRAVENEQAHFGLVPMENSTEGSIGRTLDLLLSSPLMICGEVVVRIRQQLLSHTENLAKIERVFSHAQSLGQCHEWLNLHLPKAERISVSSNAEAAKLAAHEKNCAAIAGNNAAQLYQLPVLAANIEDDPNNQTRFAVIAKQDAEPSGRDKTSLVCSAPNRPSAVRDLLSSLAEQGVSMSRFESRPARWLKGSTWEYVFFIDAEGHRNQGGLAIALADLKVRASFLKILGSYPVAPL